MKSNPAKDEFYEPPPPHWAHGKKVGKAFDKRVLEKPEVQLQRGLTTRLAEVDSLRGQKEFRHAVDKLTDLATYFEKSAQVKEFFSEDEQKNYAAAIQKRAYRLAGSIEKYGGEDSPLHRDAVRLVDRMQIDYQVHLPSALERRTSAVASIIGLIGAGIFLSVGITGNAIADVSTGTGNLLGAGFVLLAIVGGYFWIRAKN